MSTLNEEITVLQGDCRERMKMLAANAFDAIVTDPPYELGFMGKKWDSSGIAYDPVVWSEALRVLKPGGHLLAFGGSRTYHRLACAIEDAGFEIRDMIEWIYGSGFPKSLDVSKAMDKAAGVTRRVVGKRDVGPDIRGDNFGRDDGARMLAEITEAETAEAKHWDGWGTALKPAHEPICLARKPLEGTVVENVRKHGTGALNIRGCRIDGGVVSNPKVRNARGFGSDGLVQGAIDGAKVTSNGRWPANLILDSESAAALDEQSGDNCGGGFPERRSSTKTKSIYQAGWNKECPAGPRNMRGGGASRFFYTAKASGSDRGHQVKGALPLFGVEEEEWRNTHPTVKPLALMRYLLQLVCAPGALVLDPFAGSGSTLVAAKELGFSCTGIELLPEHMAIIQERLSRIK